MDVISHFKSIYYFSLINAINIVIFELLTLILKLFGIHRKEYNGKSGGSLLHNLSNGFSTSKNEKNASGIVIGKYYVGYINFTENHFHKHISLCLYCTVKTWERLSKDHTRDNMLNIFKHGSTFEVPKTNRKPWKSQKKIIDEIIANYKKNKHTCFYIYGAPGSGKTQIGQLLAEYYNSTLTNSIRIFKKEGMDNETFSISNLLYYVGPEEDNPLIIVVNEIDTILLNKIKSPNGKIEWNEFLDEYNSGFYNNTIIILTSNKSKSDIDTIDPSLLRAGRIDKVFKMTKKDAEEIPFT